MCTTGHLTVLTTKFLIVKSAKSSIFFFRSFWLTSSSRPRNNLLHPVRSSRPIICTFLPLSGRPKMKATSNIVNGTRVLCSINPCSSLDQNSTSSSSKNVRINIPTPSISWSNEICLMSSMHRRDQSLAFLYTIWTKVLVSQHHTTFSYHHHNQLVPTYLCLPISPTCQCIFFIVGCTLASLPLSKLLSTSLSNLNTIKLKSPFVIHNISPLGNFYTLLVIKYTCIPTIY